MAIKKIKEQYSPAGARQTIIRKGSMYYCVSSIIAPFSGFETLVFPCDRNGEVTDWMKVAGGPGVSHDEAIETIDNLTGQDGRLTRGKRMSSVDHRVMLQGRAHILGDSDHHVRYGPDDCPVCRAERAERERDELRSLLEKFAPDALDEWDAARTGGNNGQA